MATLIQTKAAAVGAILTAGGISPIIPDIEQLLTDLFAMLMSCFPAPTPATRAAKALAAMANPTRFQYRRMVAMTRRRIGWADPEDVVAAVRDEAGNTTVGEVMQMTMEVATPLPPQQPPAATPTAVQATPQDANFIPRR